MNVRATRLTVAGLAGGVIVALTLHVFMLAGMSADHPQPGSDMRSMTQVAVDSLAAPAPQSAPHAAAGHLIAGCFAVLAALGVLFRPLASVLQNASPTRAVTRPAAGFLRPAAEDLPPPDRPLLAAGVLLRV